MASEPLRVSIFDRLRCSGYEDKSGVVKYLQTSSERAESVHDGQNTPDRDKGALQRDRKADSEERKTA